MGTRFDARGRALYEPLPNFWTRQAGPLSPRTAWLLSRGLRGELADPVVFETRIREICTELRESAQLNWLSCVAVLAKRVSTADDATDFVDRYGADAHVQYLITALSDLPFDLAASVSDADVRQLAWFAQEVFELCRALVTLRSPSRDDYTQVLTRNLQMEALEDRFEMFGRHLTAVKEHMLDPISHHVEGELGWSVDDYWRVADAAALDATEKGKSRGEQAKHHPEIFEGLDEIGTEQLINSWLADVSFHTVDDLCRLSGAASINVTALLASLSLALDGSAVVTSPLEFASARTRSVIPLPDGRFFIPLPHLWRQEIFRVIDQRASPQLRSRWLKSRDEGVEAIVALRLCSIFGDENVLTGVRHENAGEAGETDIIVSLGDDALLVECKAHSLTAAGRRGAPDRVERKTKEIVDKSQEQIGKGRSHLLSGGELKPSRGPRTVIPLGETPLLPGLAVSFERIDPMFMLSALREAKTERVLAMSLADFLALTDLVVHPSAFVFYLSQRTELLTRVGLSAASELDYIGLFLDHQELSRLPNAPDLDAEVWVEGYGPALNALLAVTEENFAHQPLPYPPQSVLSGLAEAARAGTPGWTRVAELAHRIDARKWRPFQRMLRQSARNGSPPRRWIFRDSGLTIRIDRSAELSSITHGERTELVLGRSAAGLG